MKPQFCNICHVQIKIPNYLKEMIEKGNVSGDIKISCGNNGGKCKGYIRIKNKTDKQ